LRQDGVDLYLSTTANAAAESALRIFKWTPPPAGEWNRSEFWITGYQGFLKAVLAKRNKAMPALLCGPIAWLWQSVDAIRYRNFSLAPSDLQIERRYDFDSTFDFLWQRIEAVEPDALWSVRSRDALTWHFQRQVRDNSVWIVVVRDQSEPIAYAIFDRKDNVALSLKRMRLVDFCAISRRHEALQMALLWMINECKQQNIHTLEVFGCWLNPSDSRSIRAPYKRDLSGCSYLYSVANPELRELLRDRAVWRPSSLDGDASF
jgi:hypothetical protein